ncbi:STAS domain-containing protein [Actinokineospora soli]|uniref:STAS domain-containing protein n=1 Tax=Actinokineospora soli TaxID=1048753 RepID=A0ABW2TU01_9PSEU
MIPAAFTLASESAVITVTGEVDASNAVDFARDVDGVVGTRGTVIDLSGVRYLDSAGFAALDDLLVRHPLAVVLTPRSPLRRAAALVGLPFHDDVAAARTALG